MSQSRASLAIERSREVIEQSCRLRRRSAALLAHSNHLLERARELRARHDCFSRVLRAADAGLPAELLPDCTVAADADLAPDGPLNEDYEDMLIYDCPQIFCALERLMRLHGVSTQCSISVSAISNTSIPDVRRVEFLIEVPPEELGHQREYEIWVDDYELIFRVLPAPAE